MYSIRLEGDTRAMLRKIRGFAELDKKKINAAIGEGVRESTLERFKTSKGPDDKTWKTSIRAATEGGRTLVQTAQLRNSIRSTHQFGEQGRTIRARRAKTLRFQVGGRWVSKKKVKINIPARPYLGLSDDDMQEIKGTVEDFIARED